MIDVGEDHTPLFGIADPIASLTHLVGAVWFLLLTLVLLRRGGLHPGRFLSLAIFSASAVLLLSMSGTYHLLAPGTAARQLFQRFDHAAIFLLIAGSFTPPHVMLFRGFMRWGMLAIVWALAATGAVLMLFFFDDVPEWLGLLFYLGLGWLGAVSVFVIWRRTGTKMFFLWKPLVLGGGAYTVGAVLEFLRWPVVIPRVLGPHEFFHIAVLVGVAAHWRFAYEIVEHVHPDRSRLASIPPVVPPSSHV